jgi:hypothetical protein
LLGDVDARLGSNYLNETGVLTAADRAGLAMPGTIKWS